ncbi:MAG TPA: GGDEF domain-containing protein [Terriglobia bacterium]|nr:GGDEF domain-containing protein [Terriglobia bacterium]
MEQTTATAARNIRGRIEKLERANLVISLAALLVSLLLVATAVSVVFPDFVGKYVDLSPVEPYLHISLIVLVALALVFSFYALRVRRRLKRERREFVDELAERDTADTLALIDPQTGAFNQRYLDIILPRETGRAERWDTTLSFLKLSIEEFDTLDERLGAEAVDRILKETAEVIKKCLRPTDIIIRQGPAAFLVILPETSKHGALTGCRRLLEKVDDWNRKASVPGFELKLSIGVSDYQKGKDVRDALAAADTRVQLYRDRYSSGQ